MKRYLIVLLALALSACSKTQTERVEQLTSIELATLKHDTEPEPSGLLLAFATDKTRYFATMWMMPGMVSDAKDSIFDSITKGQSVTNGAKAPCFVLHVTHFMRTDGTDTGQEVRAIFYPDRADRPCLKSTSFSHERFPFFGTSGGLAAAAPAETSSTPLKTIQIKLPCIIEDEYENMGSHVGGP